MQMTLSQKQALQAQAEAGNFVGYTAYDPTLIAAGTPEAAAIAAGWTQGQSGSSTHLNESVYTKAAPGGTFVGTNQTNVLVPSSTPETTGDDALVPAGTTPTTTGDDALVSAPTTPVQTGDDAENTPGTPTEATETNVTA